MFNIEFKKVRESKSGKFYIKVMYEGGDADTEHPEEYQLPGVTAYNYQDQASREVIAQELAILHTLDGILDVNHPNYCDDYDEIKRKYGEGIATAYDNVPNDPQTDYEDKCYLDYIELVMYDEQGNRYEANTDDIIKDLFNER